MSGTAYAAQGVGNKLGVLIGSGVTTLILGASGYDGAATTQVASALNTIKDVYLYLLLGFAVVIFVIMCFYKLNSKNYDRIVSELERPLSSQREAHPVQRSIIQRFQTNRRPMPRMYEKFRASRLLAGPAALRCAAICAILRVR